MGRAWRRKVLHHPGADRAAARLKPDPSALKEVGDRGESFAGVTAAGAHGEDEVAQGEVVTGGFGAFLGHGRKMVLGAGAPAALGDASADHASVAAETHATALEEVGNGGSGFAGIARHAADGENEVSEGQSAGRFEGLFHGLG